MLCRDFMPRSHNASLEKRERRFDGVCVHVAMNVLLGGIDRPVVLFLHLIERIGVDGRFIRHNHFYVAPDVGVDNLAHRGRPRIAGANQPEIAIALTDADNHLRGILRTPTTLFASNVGFIYFDRATQRLWRYIQHGRTDAMAEVPRRLVADSKLALHLVSRHALARFAEKIGRKKPLPERKVRVMEDGLRCYA